MIFWRKFISFLSLVILISSFVQATQTSPGNKEASRESKPHHEIVVTATRSPVSAVQVGSSISVITAEEIARTGKSSLAEALETIFGASLWSNGGPGSVSSISIRGANAEHTLILLDGVELNDPINPSRSANLAQLMVWDVERIEILRGPQSVLYGSDALGGVINIITRKGSGSPATVISSEAGSFGTIKARARFSGEVKRLNFAVHTFFERTAGWSAASVAYPGNSEPDSNGNLTFSANLSYSVKQNSQLFFEFRRVHSRTDMDNFGGPYGDDPNYTQNYGSSFISVGWQKLPSRGSWEQKINFSLVSSRRTIQNRPDDAHPDESEDGLFSSTFIKLDWQNDLYFNPNFTVTAGLEAKQEQGQSRYASVSGFGSYGSSFPSTTARTSGLYLQGRVASGSRLFTTLGVRLDYHSTAGPALTFRSTQAFLIPETGTKLRASFGTGFKAPSLYQLYAPPTAFGPIGNLNLKPEKVLSWDMGFEQWFHNDLISIGASFFSSSLRNLIDFDFQTGYINIGHARASGIESFLKYNLLKGPQVRLGYTYLRATNLDGHQPLLRRPQNKFSIDILGRFFKRASYSFTAFYIGKRFDTNFSVYPFSRVTLPGYWLVNSYLSVDVGSSFSLFVKINNMLNKQYESVWGYGAPGLNLLVGFEKSLR